MTSLRSWLSVLACCLSGEAFADQPFAAFDGASEPVFSDPHDLAFGPDGLLYVADKFAGDLVALDPETLEVVSRIGDGGFAGIHDVSFGPDGRAYLAVTGLSAVAVLARGESGLALETMLTGFSRTEGVLAHSNGRIYVMASGTGELIALEDGTAVAAAAGMSGAHDVAEAPDGTIWVGDNFRSRLLQFDADLKLLKTLDNTRFGFVGPRYLDVDEFGRLIVADQDAHRVLMIDPVAETLLGVLGDGSPGMGAGQFDDPEGVAVQGARYWIADSDNNRVVRYSVVVN